MGTGKKARIGAGSAPGYSDRQAVRDGIVRALEPLGGMRAFVQPGQRVLLKPNFVSALPADSAAVTHPVFIAETARLVRETGAGDVCVGDSPAFGSAANVARRSGLQPLLDEMGIQLTEFRSISKSSTLLGNGRFRTLPLSGEAREFDVIINLPKAKAHCQMVLTGAVKNLYGCIPGRRKALMHCLVNNSRYLFGRMLADNARLLSPALHLLDGIDAMEGQGPTRGTSRRWGWILAGADPFAVDRVLGEALGYGLEELPHLLAARDMNAGTIALDEIELVGAALGDLRPASWRKAALLPVTFNPIRLGIGYLKHRRQWKSA